jgi:hypothetical protein
MLPLREWRKLVLQAPNVIVAGAPGTGKTTVAWSFMHAFAQRGTLCCIDPHGLINAWPWEPHGSGRDYAAVAATLAALTDEMTARYQTRGPHPPLTVLIDEVPSITLHSKRAWETHYPQLVFEGRKVGITTFILAQSTLVKPLGLDGKGDLRTSLLWLYLGDFAIEQCAACAEQPYPAALAYRGKVQPIDTAGILAYARLPIDPSARWEAPLVDAVAEAEASDAATLLDDDEARMLAMMQAGHSINAIKAEIGGDKAFVRQRIRALAEAHGVPGAGGKYQ